MVRHGRKARGFTLALFIAAWTFAGATGVFAQARASVSVGAVVVEARVAWASHARIENAAADLVRTVSATGEPTRSVLLTESGAITLSADRPASSVRRRVWPDVRIRVDYAGN